MTKENEEAIKQLKELQDKIALLYPTQKAIDFAIKALEQGDVLDKIRAEIAEYGSIWVAYAITDKIKTDKGIEKLVSDVLKQAKEQVLNVIDKYMVESEKEGETLYG